MKKSDIERIVKKHEDEILKYVNRLNDKYYLALTILELIAVSEITNIEKMQDYVKKTLKTLKGD
jgi:hypothetical protein